MPHEIRCTFDVQAYDMYLPGRTMTGQAHRPGGHVKDQIVITYEGDHIKALSDGEKSYQFAVTLWTEIRDACLKNDCFDVLGIADTTVPIETYIVPAESG